MTAPPPKDQPRDAFLDGDRLLERQVGAVLRIGVIGAATLAVAGGAVLIAHQASAPIDVATFHGEPAALRSVIAVVRGAAALDPAAIVQLALILLIATPIARVAVTVVSFARRRDRPFVAITGFVLTLLLYSLL